MRQTWRWFGTHDSVSLPDIRQAGAVGIVTALHHIPAGAEWTRAEIDKRKQEIAAGSDNALTWDVVESLPVSEEIKLGGSGAQTHIENYRNSLEALAAAGIETICYNFMPVLDWTRTDLRARMRHGGAAMRFDLVTFAAFDIGVLERAGAAADYDPATLEAALARLAAFSDTDRNALAQTVGAGLPGSADSWSLDSLRAALVRYRGIDAVQMRRNHIDFLCAVVPTAERLGLRLCCHPDDPPFALLGLPRIMSTAADYRAILNAVDSPAAGMTLCTGSFGARGDNDCAAIVREFGPRIHFAHLRNVTRDSDTVPCSFFEDEHLTGQTDMVAVVAALLDEEARRRAEGRGDWEIPMRPDHGQEILSDLTAGSQPGYPAVGRLKGLAELRGVMAALGRSEPQGAAQWA